MIALFVLLVATLAGFGLSYVLRRPRYLGRCVVEVAPYLLKVSDYLQEIERCLSPEWQKDLRQQPERVYRADVRRSLRMLTEMFRRQQRNIQVLRELAATAHHDFLKLFRESEMQFLRAKAEYARLQGLSKTAPGEFIPPGQLASIEEVIEAESSKREFISQRLDMLKVFDRRCGRLVSAYRWPLVKMRMIGLIPFEQWRFIPVPSLTSFGHSGSVELLREYQTTKQAGLDLISLLHPGADFITREILTQL